MIKIFLIAGAFVFVTAILPSIGEVIKTAVAKTNDAKEAWQCMNREIKDNVVRLSFDDFLQYYKLNPSAYNIITLSDKYYCVSRHKKAAKKKKFNILFKTFEDYKKFIQWVESNQDKADYSDDAATADFLQSVQNDINSIKTELGESLQQQEEVFEKTMQNIGQGLESSYQVLNKVRAGEKTPCAADLFKQDTDTDLLERDGNVIGNNNVVPKDYKTNYFF